MESTFFQSIAALNVKGEWKIVISQTIENNLIVSVLLCNEQCGDDARKLIPPILLKGSPKEIDEGFLNAIEAPVKVTSQLFVNMESYLKQQELAQLESKLEKDKVAKAASNKTDKEKKYETALKKVDELEAEGKFKEAWMKVPEATEYPEHADSLRKRREALSPKFAPSLF